MEINIKTTFNITTWYEDTDRYESQDDLRKSIEDLGFDGLEIMATGADERNIIPADKVIGLHMSYDTMWVDFWNQDEANLIKQFGSVEAAYEFYGSDTPDVLVQRYKQDLENAHKYGAEYVVFHVAEETVLGGFNFQYHHTDEEVIKATTEILDQVFENEDGSILLLLENLWQPGLTLTRPESTRLLLDSVNYPNTGIMMDTGHLLHTNFDLRTESEGIDYILKQLDNHADMVELIRGIHMQQSLTGAYCRKLIEEPYPYSDDFNERYSQMFCQVFKIDEHKPWTDKRAREIIERVKPDYLTYEFISDTRENHERMLQIQKATLCE